MTGNDDRRLTGGDAIDAADALHVARRVGLPDYDDFAGKASYLSPTSISEYRMCPMRLYLRYTKGPMAPTTSMCLGRAVHSVAEKVLNRKMAGDIPDEGEVDDIARMAADEAMSGNIRYSQHEIERGIPLVVQNIAEETRFLATEYLNHLVPKIEPRFVEYRLFMKHPAVPLPFRMVLDVVDKSDQVRDLKCRGVKVSLAQMQSEAGASMQLTAYHLAATTMIKGFGGDVVVLDNLVRHRPGAYTTQGHRSSEDHDVFLAIAIAVCHAVEHEVFVPVSHMAWWCSANTCAYYDVCPYASQRRRPKS